MRRILRAIGYAWFVLAILVIVFGIAGMWRQEGDSMGMSLVNILAMLLLLAPAFILLAWAKKFPL